MLCCCVCYTERGLEVSWRGMQGHCEDPPSLSHSPHEDGGESFAENKGETDHPQSENCYMV